MKNFQPIQWLKGFFDPTDVKTSITRLGFLILHVFAGYLIYNAVQISYVPNVIVNNIVMDKSVILNFYIALIGIVLGTAYGGKVWSKYAENKELTIQKQPDNSGPEVK